MNCVNELNNKLLLKGMKICIIIDRLHLNNYEICYCIHEIIPGNLYNFQSYAPVFAICSEKESSRKIISLK